MKIQPINKIRIITKLKILKHVPDRMIVDTKSLQMIKINVSHEMNHREASRY